MDRKGQIYRYIKTEISDKGLPPTIREIGSRFNISSTNGVRYFLNKLEDDGLIERQNRTARGIKVIERLHALTGTPVPILGRVPAGKPSFSEENVEDTILLDSNLARGPGVFAVRVHGDSMVGAGINDGDIAVVKPNPLPQSGEIVVALIEDEVTLKRIIKRGREVILRPENDDYPEMNLTKLGHDRIRILGSVLTIIRRFY
ncbi:MAG: transcriptional repressor LexA [Candidatus Eisenbacteria bacterium]